MTPAASTRDTYTPPEITLTVEQRKMVDDTLRLLQDIGPLIQKAQSCGIECSGHEQLRQHLHDLLSNVKQQFGTYAEPMLH